MCKWPAQLEMSNQSWEFCFASTFYHSIPISLAHVVEITCNHKARQGMKTGFQRIHHRWMEVCIWNSPRFQHLACVSKIYILEDMYSRFYFQLQDQTFPTFQNSRLRSRVHLPTMYTIQVHSQICSKSRPHRMTSSIRVVPRHTMYDIFPANNPSIINFINNFLLVQFLPNLAELIIKNTQKNHAKPASRLTCLQRGSRGCRE